MKQKREAGRKSDYLVRWAMKRINADNYDSVMQTIAKMRKKGLKEIKEFVQH